MHQPLTRTLPLLILSVALNLGLTIPASANAAGTPARKPVATTQSVLKNRIANDKVRQRQVLQLRAQTLQSQERTRQLAARNKAAGTHGRPAAVAAPAPGH